MTKRDDKKKDSYRASGSGSETGSRRGTGRAGGRADRGRKASGSGYSSGSRPSLIGDFESTTRRTSARGSQGDGSRGTEPGSRRPANSGRDSGDGRSRRAAAGFLGFFASIPATVDGWLQVGDGGDRRSSRDAWLLVFFLVFVLALFIRLFFLQVVYADEYSSSAEARRTVVETVYAKRGTIYDRNGNILATSVDAVDICANPSQIADPQATSTVLAEVLGGEASTYLEKIAGDSKFAYVVRQADVSVADQLKVKYDDYQEQIAAMDLDEDEEPPANPLAGIYTEDTVKRVYPYGQVAGQVIGYVNRDGVGVSGLEQYYDDILRGFDGEKVVEQGRRGIQIPGGVKVSKEPVKGRDITVSIDIDLQQYAEEQLVAYAQESEAVGGEFMVLDGATGEILATASLPLYDLNNVSAAPEGAWALRTISHVYEPGSSFKTVTAAALLEEGLTKPDEVIDVPSELKFNDRTIKDNHDHPDEKLSFAEIIEQSSNIGISILEDRMESETFASYLEKFGFGQRLGVDHPSESKGILDDVENWIEVQEANISFGQSMSATTLQMASFYGTLANNGVRVQPHFLIGYADTGEQVSYESEQVISAATCGTLENMLRGVVTNGTGTLIDVPGYEPVGKTGTAQKVVDGEYSKDMSILDFAGWLAHTNSAIVCMAVMDNPAMSSAMPLWSSIMQHAAETYRIIPDSALESAASTTDAAGVNAAPSEDGAYDAAAYEATAGTDASGEGDGTDDGGYYDYTYYDDAYYDDGSGYDDAYYGDGAEYDDYGYYDDGAYYEDES